MKTFQIWLAIPALLISTACSAQIKNQKTDTVHIYGNCGMCEQKIEKAGNMKKTASVDWDKSTKMAVLKYNSKKTNKEEILKRIALSGYDSDEFLAPDEVYNKLPGCCKYDRKAKATESDDADKAESAEMMSQDHTSAVTEKSDQFKPVFDKYFDLKDALVKSDGEAGSSKAQELSKTLKAVEMGKLNPKEHMAWMKVMKDMNMDVQRISETKNVDKQRDFFISLSENMYSLMKVSEQESPVYFQHCPMANDGKGANWLSKENTIKNPYFGAKMLSCGKTIETIK